MDMGWLFGFMVGASLIKIFEIDAARGERATIPSCAVASARNRIMEAKNEMKIMSAAGKPHQCEFARSSSRLTG
jgi:hypothetical protein